MRVRLVFNLVNKGAELPFHHQYIITNFLLEYIETYLRSVKEPDKVFYNFSSLKGQTSLGKGSLQFLSNKVSIIFTSNDEGLIDYLIYELYNKSLVMLGRLELVPANVDKENPIDFATEMKYVCLSPIAIANPMEDSMFAQKYINPSFDLFSDTLYENTLNRMEQAGYSSDELSLYYQFQLIPDKEYLSKMKDGQKKIARVFPVFIQNEKLELRGYIFPFKLYAHPKVQEFIFTCGFGTFAEKGFGMLDIANTDPNVRVIPYSLKKK